MTEEQKNIHQYLVTIQTKSGNKIEFYLNLGDPVIVFNVLKNCSDPDTGVCMLNCPIKGLTIFYLDSIDTVNVKLESSKASE